MFSVVYQRLLQVFLNLLLIRQDMCVLCITVKGSNTPMEDKQLQKQTTFLLVFHLKDISCTFWPMRRLLRLNNTNNNQPHTQTNGTLCTHWFSSTSRMNFRPKALTWKLAWARWLTWGGRDHDGFFYTWTKCSCSDTDMDQFYWYARVNSNLHRQLPGLQ